jgi:HD superfamily phosphohydrolase YqeK
MTSFQEATHFFLKIVHAELIKELPDEIRDYLTYKVQHSYGVLASAQKIISLDPALSLTKSETKREFEISALLHDIGRFSQHDGKRRLKNSEHPHGEIGYDILKRLGIHNPRILLSVKHHNKYDLSELESELDYMMADTSEKEKITRICGLIRDADKLQNLEYLLYDPSKAIKKTSERETKSVSDACFEAIKKRQQMTKKYAETGAEYLLYYFSWIFDLHHEGTKIALRQMRFRERFGDILMKL